LQWSMLAGSGISRPSGRSAGAGAEHAAQGGVDTIDETFSHRRHASSLVDAGAAGKSYAAFAGIARNAAIYSQD